ncbi:MAG: hypothetical protein COA45_08005 [Zetaproteobacteria bacterium]|nr:MAG: hypothetical protein COA45_08005 [Zetaproteobacteria bacterium]
MTLDAPVTEKNIGLLLDRGAQGSIASYFPVSDESLDNPFNDNDAFEVMSLRDFCQENNHLFSPDMLSALKGDNTLSNEHGLN